MDKLNIIYKEPINLQLTENNSSHIDISMIPNYLLNFDFDKLFNLHPEKRHNIIMRNKNSNKEVFRWQKSYLNTPNYDKDDEYFKTRNYMYSGLDTSQNNEDLPELFKPFYDYVKSLDSRYNQVIINWYDNNDYIDFHRDCQRKIIEGVPIIIINLNEGNENSLRNFELIPFEENPENVKPKYDNVSINLKNGLMIKMCGNIQTEFRHGIRRNEKSKKRISISFRALNN